MLNVVVISFVMLSVVVISFVMLSVVMLSVAAPLRLWQDNEVPELIKRNLNALVV